MLFRSTGTVQALAKAMDHMDRRQRQIDEAKERAEQEALNKLREERKKEAEASRKFKGKGVQKSPSPPKSSSSDSEPKSPPPANFPSPQRTPPREKTPPKTTDTAMSDAQTERTTTDRPTTAGGSSSAREMEEVLALREELAKVKKERDQERESHQLFSDLSSRYLEDWKVATKKVEERDGIIKELTRIGLETMEVPDGETLKKGMCHLMKKNKELEVEYKKMSDQYDELLMKDVDNVYRYENTRLNKTLEAMHEKCMKTEEAYQEAMRLYQSTRKVPRSSRHGAPTEVEAYQERIDRKSVV